MSALESQPAAGSELRYAVAPIVGLELRDASQTGDGSHTMSGYAAVFNSETTLYDTRYWRLRERIAPGAFREVLSADDLLVHLNFGHDMNRAVAATNVTGIGGLELSEDERGLHFFARVDADDPDVQAMAVKMRRGVVGQASFAFYRGEVETRITELDDGREDELVTHMSFAEIFDVCACAQGAYPQTVSQLRSYAAAFMGRAEEAGPRHRAAEAGVVVVAQGEGGQSDKARVRSLAVLRAKARAATFTQRSTR